MAGSYERMNVAGSRQRSPRASVGDVSHISVAALILTDTFVALVLFISSQAFAGSALCRVMLWGALASLSATTFLMVTNRTSVGSYAFSIVQAGFLYWYIVPIALAALREGVTLGDGTRFGDASELAMGAATVFVAKSMSSIAYAVIPHRGRSESGLLHRVSQHAPLPTWLVVLQLALGLTPIVLVKNPIIQLLAGRSGDLFRRPNKGNADTLAFLLFYFLFAASLLSLYALLTDGRRGRRLIYKIIFAVSTGASILTGGARTLLLLLVMPGLMLFAMTRRRILRAHAATAVSVILLYFLANVMVSYRETGFSSYRPGASIEDRNFEDSDFFGELLFSRRIVPAEREFSYESPILYLATGLVPRVLWPDKPDAKNSEYVMRLRMGQLSGELEGNALPGIVGQYWQVSGWLGIASCGLWLGLAAAFLRRKLLQPSLQTRYCALVAAWVVFISFRNLSTGNFVPLVLCLFTFWSAARLRRTERLQTLHVREVARLHSMP